MPPGEAVALVEQLVFFNMISVAAALGRIILAVLVVSICDAVGQSTRGSTDIFSCFEGRVLGTVVVIDDICPVLVADKQIAAAKSTGKHCKAIILVLLCLC